MEHLSFISTRGGQGGRKIHKRYYFGGDETVRQHFLGLELPRLAPLPAPTLQQRQVTPLAMPPMRDLV